MSLGIGVFAKLELEDDKTVIYKYGCMNLNEPGHENKEHVMDGLITIDKSCFKEPEIHQKLKRMPNGRKKLVSKKIIVDVDYPKMVNDGLISVENCSFCWQTTTEHIDAMVGRLLFRLFIQYQEEEKIPESIFAFS